MKVFYFTKSVMYMKEIHNLYLLAILGLLVIIALGISLEGDTSFANFGVISIFILGFIGLFGIAFSVEKKSGP